MAAGAPTSATPTAISWRSSPRPHKRVHGDGACRPRAHDAALDAIQEAVGAGVSGLGLSRLAGALRPLFPNDPTTCPRRWSRPKTPRPRGTGCSALAELLERLKVFALVVEDLHWADEATVEFLLFLASRVPQPLSLVLTYRPEDPLANAV